jgi:carbon monoxide dehydrogenase subunit G
VSEYPYERSFLVAAPVGLVVRFFADGEAWYRLNPEWEVLALERDATGQRLKVRYERSEREADYCRPASADFSNSGGTIVLTGAPARTIDLQLKAEGQHTRIDWREAFADPIETARLAELNLWLDATAGYLAFAARKDRRARLTSWLLDRVWLRMSPMSRRISLMIVGMEFLALLLFIAIVIVYRLTS